MRHRKNTFLDLVNREVFLPRGLCAMVMTFKDDEGGPRRTGPLRQLFSQQQMRLGDGDDGMYAPDEGAAAAVDQAIAKARASGRQSSSLSSKFKSATMLSAGQTQGDAALPECAPLVFPAVDETQDKGGKMRAAKAWKDDFLDRRANVFYVSQ